MADVSGPPAATGDGFDWGDAAIGAGAGLLAAALLMMGAGASGGRRTSSRPKPGGAVSRGPRTHRPTGSPHPPRRRVATREIDPPGVTSSGSVSLLRLVLGVAPRKAGQAVVGELLPGGGRVDEAVVAGPYGGLAVERSQTHRDLGAVGPGATEQARAAARAEGLSHPALRPVGPDQFLAGEQPKRFAGDAPLRHRGAARRLATARAVAEVRPRKGAVSSNLTPAQRQLPASGRCKARIGGLQPFVIGQVVPSVRFGGWAPIRVAVGLERGPHGS